MPSRLLWANAKCGQTTALLFDEGFLFNHGRAGGGEKKMYFLIDYENVKNLGMRGTEYLLPTDHVIVFYSKNAPNMEQRYLEDIKNAGCGFEICKLKSKRKNGLDFYIATRLGELFGSGCCDTAVLVSKDEGFQAIREYWTECSAVRHRVTISESIERGIVSANEVGERAERIRMRMKTTDIGTFFALYEENLKLRRLLEEIFATTEFACQIDQIEEILKNGKTAKVIYLDSLRSFGRKNGLKIYQTLKGSMEFQGIGK